MSANADFALEIGGVPVALVGMSSPSGTAGATLPEPAAHDSERDRDRNAASAPVSDANGMPVDDLPPLIEPSVDPFESLTLSGEILEPRPGPPPPSPKAPVILPPVPVAASVAEATPVEVVKIVSAPLRTPVIPTPGRAVRSVLAAPGAAMRGIKRHRYVLGGVCVAIIAIVAVAYVTNVGPFAHVEHYSIAAAPKDPAQRVAYFQRGADAGDAGAELELAIIYAKGDGVAQDYAKSASWFRAAADQGVPRAQYDLGVMYERGRGVKLDLTEAANWYLKSATAGYALAQYNLAVCYTKGQGIRQDLNEAALWYRRAATQGVRQAMINLAVMYDRGQGVTASPVDAYAWYLAAGRRGDDPAARRAKDVYNGMTKQDQIHADVLASDVANSIHEPAAGSEAAAAVTNAEEH
ncbi:MAG: tetratricopeptide repeat protein [Stellaceae bacterium]